MREPFNLTVEQIWKLDDWTLFNVYLRPRDQKGRLRARPQKTPKRSEKDEFFDWYRTRGIPDWRVEPLWREHRRK